MKTREAILQAVGQRSQLILEVLDTMNETWTKFRGEEFVPSRLADKESWPTRKVDIQGELADKDVRVEQDEANWIRSIWCVAG